MRVYNSRNVIAVTFALERLLLQSTLFCALLSAATSMSMDEEMARNAALRATLSKLKAPAEEAVVEMSAAQIKAVSALKVIDMQETEMGMLQKIKEKEMRIKHLQEEIKAEDGALKQCQGEIEKERSSGKAVWEMVGISTVSYRDPFHTGLSKRTPTGAPPAQNEPTAPSTHMRAHTPRPTHLRAILRNLPRWLTYFFFGPRTGGYFTS